jgi:hypothetical protein
MARTIPLEDFHAEVKAQGVSGREHVAFRCVLCKCVQSGRSLIEAGAGADMASVEKYVGFSCVGRWTGAGAPRNKPDGKPCDWTLGGLFGFADLYVSVPERAEPQASFELATPEEAQALERSWLEAG